MDGGQLDKSSEAREDYSMSKMAQIPDVGPLYDHIRWLLDELINMI